MNKQKESPRLRVLFLRIMVSERTGCLYHGFGARGLSLSWLRSAQTVRIMVSERVDRLYHGFGARRLFVSWLRSVRAVLIVTSALFSLRRIALVSRARSALAVRVAERGGDNRPICGFGAGCAAGVRGGNGEPFIPAMPHSALREKFTGKNLKFKAKID